VSSPAILDIDSLVKPIPGANPAGHPLPDGKRLELDDLRKEPDPLDPATANRNPDWNKIIRTTSEMLVNSSKDLLAAARLLEAATKKSGVPGLRDGLKFLHRLVTDCWEHLHPMPEEGEGFDVREGPMKWLNDVGRGARFPQAVAGLILLRTGTGDFSYFDWLEPTRKAEFEEAIPRADPAAVKQMHEDLIEAREALTNLATTLDEKMGAEVAPDFLTAENDLNLGTAINRCIGMVEEIAHRRGVRLKEEDEAAAESSEVAPATGSSVAVAAGPAGIANTRDGLYRQLSQIAIALRNIEPHSPVPFLLERCVRLGAMPFPELMRAIIRENGTLDELDRLLGMEKKDD